MLVLGAGARLSWDRGGTPTEPVTVVELEPNPSRVSLGSTPLTACSVSSDMAACLSQAYVMSFFLLILFIITNLSSYPRFESLPCSNPFGGRHCRLAEASWSIRQSGSPQHAPPFHNAPLSLSCLQHTEPCSPSCCTFAKALALLGMSSLHHCCQSPI